jgi:hypothetical protein
MCVCVYVCVCMCVCVYVCACVCTRVCVRVCVQRPRLSGADGAHRIASIKCVKRLVRVLSRERVVSGACVGDRENVIAIKPVAAADGVVGVCCGYSPVLGWIKVASGVMPCGRFSRPARHERISDDVVG